MVDGVDKDAHILDHGDAVSARGGGIEHLLNVQVGLPGIHPPLGNGDKGFAPPVLGQAQDSPGVALSQAIVQHELPLVGGQLQQPQLVGKGGLCHAQPLGRLGLGAVPKGDHIPQPLCLLKGVQVFPLDVFQQTQRRSPLIAAVTEDGRNGLHPGQLAGAEPPPNALKQLIADADWGELDYFVLDTPPGTSDIHLTLLQTLAITGAVIVSTPQSVALADARKGIDMYQNDKVNVPILGLVENMAWFTPAELPENKYYIFGKEGCKNLAKEMNVPLLAQIPLVQSICENGDNGTPAALDINSITGQAFISLAQAVVTVTNKRNREMAATKIVEVKK